MSLTASFAGFLASPPETRITETGRTLTRFRVGVNDQFRDATGEFKDRPTIWVNCQVWGNLAEAIRDAYFPTGAAVVCTGEWRQNDWTDKATGESRSTRFVEVEHLGADLAVRRKSQPAAPVAQPAAQPAADTAATDSEEVNPL